MLAGTRIESAGGVTVVQGKVGDVDGFLVSRTEVCWRKEAQNLVSRADQVNGLHS